MANPAGAEMISSINNDEKRRTNYAFIFTKLYVAGLSLITNLIRQ